MNAILWFVLLCLFIWVEASTITVVSMWFAVGALVAMIASLFGSPFWLDLILFFSVSIVLLLCLRPLARRYLTPKLVKTNVDTVVGAKGRVLEQIDNIAAQGRVKINAMEWSARSTDGTVISQDTLVVVDRVEGVKIFVSVAE